MSDRDQQAAHLSELSEARLLEASALLERAAVKFQAARVADDLAATKLDLARQFYAESLENLNHTVASATLARRRLFVAIGLLAVAVIVMVVHVVRYGW